MLGSELVDPGTGETFRVESMRELLKDWTGGCINNPANMDVGRVLFELGIITPKRLVALAHGIAEGTLNETQLASVIHEFLKHRKVRIRLQRHALKYHQVPRKQSKRDLKELEEETAAIMRRAGLSPWGES
jgi:hypothetical protein